MEAIIADILNNPIAFLKFMNANKYPVVHESNIFYRDIQFAISKYIEEKTGKKSDYFERLQPAADQVCAAFEQAGLLKKVSRQAYVVNCKEFMLPRPEPAPAKPAAAPAETAA